MKRSFYIAGVQFRSKGEINLAAKEMEVNDELTLVAEPTNKYDPNAVQILATDGTFLGYVPKKFSSEISAMLEIEAPIICTVEVVNPTAKHWEMFKVIIQDEEEEK